MEALYMAAAETLLEGGIPVLHGQPPSPAQRLRSAQVSLQLRSCTLEGRAQYLGLFESQGEQLELYSHRAKATLEARAHSPAEGGAQAAAALGAQIAACWLRGVPNVTITRVQTGTAEYDPALDCFVCPVQLALEAWLYAVPSGDELYFEDFMLRGTLLSRQKEQEETQ